MKLKIIATLSISTLMSCNLVAEIQTPPVEVTKTASFQSAGIVGFSDTTVRARTVQEGRSGTEMRNIPCELKSAGYFAKFTTPSIVNLPSYGEASPSIFVSCKYNGKVATKTVKVHNFSQQQRTNKAQSSAAGGGLLGVILISAIDAATNKARPGDIYKYNVGWIEFPSK